MEETLLYRLNLLANEIKRNSDLIKEGLHFLSDEDRHNAEVIYTKLQNLLRRLNDDINNYFRLITDPSANDISRISEIQLEAEQNLAELGVKIKTTSKVSETSTKENISRRLPELSLLPFDGNTLNWCQFWDQFSSSIDSKNIAEVDKLLYLKASITGEAKGIIDGLETNNKNYHIALRTLKERYGKASHLIDAHYVALSKVQASDKNISKCRRTLNDLERHLRVLESLNEDVNHNHLRHLIFSKFPEDLIYELKLKTVSDSIHDIRKNLEVIITAREEAWRITHSVDNKREYTVETLLVNQNKFSHKNKRISHKRKPVLGTQFKGNFINPEQRRPNLFHAKYPDNKWKRKGEYRGGPNIKRMKVICDFCNGNHYSSKCLKYKTIAERKLQMKNRCFSCLKEGHTVYKCTQKKVCYFCRKSDRHNQALCPVKFPAGQTTITTLVNNNNFTILPTAIVSTNKTGSNICKKYRALFDSGSQRTYVTNKVAKELDLQVEEHDHLTVFTFGSKAAQEMESPLVQLELECKTQNKKIIYANVVPMITHGVPAPLDILGKEYYREILSDDGSLSDRIDILIGNDYYYSCMLLGKRKLEENLFLVESEFGWILSGKSEIKSTDTLSVVTYFQNGMETKLNLPDPPMNQGSISFLWELESIGITDSPKSNRDKEAVDNFNNTTRIINNRYSVSWPWNEYPPSISSNYGLAYGRLVSLIKRSDIRTLQIYDETLNEQIKKGIIEIVPQSDNVRDYPVHYLPHHCVVQRDKPIRIVYDASAKSKEGKSLNQCLYCGPLMLEDLTSLIIRFRYHRIALSADVEKAFLQIALHKRDRDVTRFFWIKDITQPPTKENLVTMRFCRVPFGIISSPFILNATIKHHLSKSDKQHIRNMGNDIYVDNLLTGACNVNEALQLYNDSKEVFSEISMNIREWSSNSKEFMRCIPDASSNEIVKVLGLNWELEKDTLSLRFNNETNVKTKRDVLKVIASVYDPCGYSIPQTLAAKLFLQKLWKLKVKWDTTLTTVLLTEWLNIRKELDEIPKLSLNRCYFKGVMKETYQLHCFTDASLKAYAAVVYIANGKEINFVMGKSRLVPLKDQENLKIPRLELLGVVIGSRLIKFINKQLQGKAISQTLWTDSQIVIEWCKSSKLLPPFVARRIEEIKKNKNLIIKHISSTLNPADVATRPNKSQEEKLRWLEGPTFLTGKTKEKIFSFSVGEGLPTEENELHEEPITIDEVQKETDEKGKESTTSLCEELKRLQATHFPLEVQGKETDLSRNLRLFRDVDGILRCKGRLKNANWSFDKRYPIIIPKECDFTDKVILQTHVDNYHVGVNHTLSIIRENYWIPQGKRQVQKLLKQCTSCQKHSGGPYKLPDTPALPSERANYSSPFTFVGVDYMGPLLTKDGNQTTKRWICLFTCLAVRAVHLEVVKDLTAEEGLLALRRMISSRGVPSLITSDNATHFKLLSEILMNQYCIKEKIKWKFIPQLAPWFGGFYERLIGIVKNCLKKTLQKHMLKDSQLCTVTKEIEAVVNTRPLTSVDSELDHILKPSDFLTMGKCIEITPSVKDHLVDGTVTKSEVIKGWKRAIIILEEFKEMFMNRYLLSLRERYQHSKKEPRIISKLEPKVGQIVQIKGDTKNRECWKVGKIITLIKGTDGLCRVAKVLVGNKEFTRSISHLYPLEIDEEQDESCFNSTEIHDHEQLLTPLEPISVRDIEMSTPKENTIKNTEAKDSNDLRKDVRENSIEIQTQNPEESEVLIDNTKRDEDKETRVRRGAAIRALEKIRAWTRSLLTLF